MWEEMEIWEEIEGKRRLRISEEEVLEHVGNAGLERIKTVVGVINISIMMQVISIQMNLINNSNTMKNEASIAAISKLLTGTKTMNYILNHKAHLDVDKLTNKEVVSQLNRTVVHTVKEQIQTQEVE